jgi:hypothetical protein
MLKPQITHQKVHEHIAATTQSKTEPPPMKNHSSFCGTKNQPWLHVISLAHFAGFFFKYMELYAISLHQTYRYKYWK